MLALAQNPSSFKRHVFVTNYAPQWLGLQETLIYWESSTIKKKNTELCSVLWLSQLEAKWIISTYIYILKNKIIGYTSIFASH